jgi:gluconate 5-dehydrogenase
MTGIDLFDLAGKVALVTGAGQGLGLTIARGLAQAGATVVVNDKDAAVLAAALATLSAEGHRVHGSVFSVTDAAEIATEIPRVEREVGPIQILCNNAGIQRRAPLEECDEALWREVLDVNVTGIFLVTRQVVRGMIARMAGKVINLCSVMSEVARPTTAPYTTSKGGVKMLTKTMAVEWAKHNIQVNGIGPGYMLGGMGAGVARDPAFHAWICSRTPAGRWGDPSELVGAAVFLASAASNYVNGHIIYVDGGMLAAL